MAVDGLQNYIQMMSGMTKATRAKAVEAAKSLLAQTGLNDVASDAGERVTKLAEELLAASRANRELLEKLIKAEVDKAATRLGFVRAEDLEALRTEIADLRRTVEEKAAGAASVKVSPATDPPLATARTRKAATKKAAAKKAAAKRAPRSSRTEDFDYDRRLDD
jgi:polyhydroxyalkanoate synthesis regulator phasin